MDDEVDEGGVGGGGGVGGSGLGGLGGAEVVLLVGGVVVDEQAAVLDGGEDVEDLLARKGDKVRPDGVAGGGGEGGGEEAA